VTFTST